MRARLCITGGLLALVAPALGNGASAPAASVRGLGDDIFLFGGKARVETAVSGDLIAAGGQVEVDAAVAGDAVIAGGEVRVQAPVGRNAYVAGGRVRIEAALGRNLRVAGGQVELGSTGSVAGNVTASGGHVELRAPVHGSVLVGGGRVLIDAAVQGDVDVTAARLALGPNARIAGKLRYRGGTEVQRDAQAQVTGGVEASLPPGSGASAPCQRESVAGHHRGARWGWLAVWTFGLALLAVVLVAVLPRSLTECVAHTWRERFGWSVLWGFVALVCVPVAVLILLTSIIGAPLALVTLLLYGALLLVGYVASALALGQWGLARFKPAAAAHTAWRLLAVVLGVLLLALLCTVPWLGWIVALAAVLAGVGAMLQLLRTPRAA
jgi:cytoskeletal protein CcmA (bactofilin family)